MKVLITGARGQVGHELMHSAPEWAIVSGFSSRELDITDKSSVMAVCYALQPNIIINAAAYTLVDKAESESDMAFAVNSEGVDNLGMIAAEFDIPILHISTDYVFDGVKKKPYSESDACYPQSIYGKSKLAGEQLLIARTHKNIIIRTSWVFGCQGNNFVKTMIKLGREREVLRIIHDQVGCPTSARSIAKTLWDMAEIYYNHRRLPWGIYHFCNREQCSWYEFACAIFDEAVKQGILAQAPIIEPILTKEYPLPAKRPKFAVMSSKKLVDNFQLPLFSWKAELRNMLTQCYNI